MRIDSILLIALLFANIGGCSGASETRNSKNEPIPVTPKATPGGAPAFSGLTKARQPDGSMFVLRLRGDAWRHWHETVDGYSIVYNRKDKTWYYAQCLKDKLTRSKIRVGQKLTANWPKHLRPGVSNCGQPDSPASNRD